MQDAAYRFVSKTMPNISIIVHIGTFLFLLGQTIWWWFLDILLYAAFYLLFAGILEYRSWVNGVEAIRRIDSSWLEQTEGLYLPTIFGKDEDDTDEAIIEEENVSIVDL